MATIDMGDKPAEEAKQHILKTKYAIITIHDVSPIHSERVFCFADKIKQLSIPFNFAMIPCHDEKKSNDIRNNIDLVEGVKRYEQDIALHGLYHEHNGDIEEFHNLSREEARGELKKGLEIFDSMCINTDIFVPPTWTINKNTMDALENLKFNIVETEQEILILSKNTRLLTNILNWDVGSPMLNQRFLQINKSLFRNKVMGNTEMIRIALHPKDPPEALATQCEMIMGLIDLNYNFIKYSDIAKLYG